MQKAGAFPLSKKEDGYTVEGVIDVLDAGID
jgi:hypothetical protein